MRHCLTFVAPWFAGLLCPVLAQFPPHSALANPAAGLQDVRMAREGDIVHLVGVTNVPVAGFVHYARSDDGGRSFAVHDVPIAYIGANSLNAGRLGDLAVDDRLVGVVVSTPWGGPHVIASPDGGDTWRAPTRISQQSNTWTASATKLVVRGNTLVVLWPESRSGLHHWCNRSTDGGLTWQPQDTQLDASLGASTTNGMAAVFLGAQLHVFLDLAAPAQSIGYCRSGDHGATWTTTLLPFGFHAVAHAAGSQHALVVAGPDAVHLQRSVDQGATWSPLTVPGLQGTLQALAVREQRILAVTLQGAVPTNALLQTSTDAGNTWLPTPFAVGVYRYSGVTAHATADAFYVHWRFDWSLPPPAAVIQSDDDGASWRMVTGEASLGLLASDDGCLVTTRSNHQSTDVRVWSMGGHTHHGQGRAGSGGFVPRLTGRGVAGLGRTFTIELDRARGGALGAVFHSVAPGLTATPLGGNTLHLLQPIVGNVFTATGVSGLPGAGTASVSLQVPMATAFVGHRIASQAFVVDPAMPEGFVGSAAVESWLY